MALENLGGLAMHIILSKLRPADTASVACVSRRLRTWASEDDSLWFKYCLDDLQFDSPQDPEGNPLPSFKVSGSFFGDFFFFFCFLYFFLGLCCYLVERFLFICTYNFKSKWECWYLFPLDCFGFDSLILCNRIGVQIA